MQIDLKYIRDHKALSKEQIIHLERSHRTDDDEFYIPRALEIRSEADLLNEAMARQIMGALPHHHKHVMCPPSIWTRAVTKSPCSIRTLVLPFGIAKYVRMGKAHKERQK